MTRPNLAYALLMCGRYIASPSQDYIDALDNVYAYIKSTPQASITYIKQKPVLKSYVDAD